MTLRSFFSSRACLRPMPATPPRPLPLLPCLPVQGRLLLRAAATALVLPLVVAVERALAAKVRSARSARSWCASFQWPPQINDVQWGAHLAGHCLRCCCWCCCRCCCCRRRRCCCRCCCCCCCCRSALSPAVHVYQLLPTLSCASACSQLSPFPAVRFPFPQSLHLQPYKRHLLGRRCLLVPRKGSLPLLVVLLVPVRGGRRGGAVQGRESSRLCQRPMYVAARYVACCTAWFATAARCGSPPVLLPSFLSFILLLSL
jgi:hypothetical protein